MFGRSLKPLMQRFMFRSPGSRSTEIASLANAAMTRGTGPLPTRQASAITPRPVFSHGSKEVRGTAPSLAPVMPRWPTPGREDADPGEPLKRPSVTRRAAGVVVVPSLQKVIVQGKPSRTATRTSGLRSNAPARRGKRLESRGEYRISRLLRRRLGGIGLRRNRGFGQFRINGSLD